MESVIGKNQDYGGQSREEWDEQKIGKMLESIQNPELAKAPSVNLTDEAKREFGRIAKDIKKQTNNLFLVIRCWNKTENDLKELFDRLKKMQSNIPEMQGVFIVINAGGDKDAQTSRAVDSLVASESLSFKVVATPVAEYSWTAGLNAPAALLHSVCKEEDADETKQFVLNYSFDAVMSEAANQEIADHIRSGEPLMTARVEESVDSKKEIEIVQEENRENFTRMMDKFYDFLTNKDSEFSAEEFTNDYHKAMVTLGRNTSMLFSLADIVRLGGFDRSCNALGGMEDHDFVFRLFLDIVKKIKYESDPKLQDELVDKLRAYNEAFKEPLPYNDPAWNRMPQGDEAVGDKKATGRIFKYDHERKALQQIGARLAEQFQSDKQTLRVPVSEQDFRFV